MIESQMTHFLFCAFFLVTFSLSYHGSMSGVTRARTDDYGGGAGGIPGGASAGTAAAAAAIVPAEASPIDAALVYQYEPLGLSDFLITVGGDGKLLPTYISFHSYLVIWKHRKGGKERSNTVGAVDDIQSASSHSCTALRLLQGPFCIRRIDSTFYIITRHSVERDAFFHNGNLHT